jgi:hypothetical protein
MNQGNNNNNNSNINLARSPSHANSSNNSSTNNNVNKKHLINTRHRKIVAKKDESSSNPQQSLVSPPSSSNVGQSILNTSIALGASPTTNTKRSAENSLETHSLPEHRSLVLEEKDSRISQLEKEKNELNHQNESLGVTNNLLKENISNLSMQLQSSLVENQKFLEKIKFLEDRFGDGNSNYNYNYPRPNITLEMSDITDQNHESPLRRRKDIQEKDNHAMNYNNNQMHNNGNNQKIKDNNNSYHFKYDGFDHGTDDYYNNGHPNTNNAYRNNNYYLQTSSLSPMPVPATALENSIDNGQDYAQIPNPDYYYHPYPMMTGEEEGEFYDPLCAEEDEGEEYDEEQKERSQQRKVLRKDDSFFLTQEKWIKKESMYLANIHYLLELLQEMGQSYQFMVQQTQQMQQNQQQQQQQSTQGEWRPNSPSHRNNNSSNQEPESERPLPRPPSKKQFLQQQQYDRQQDSQKEILSRLVESNYSFLHKQQQKLAQQKHFLLQQQRQQFQQQQNQQQQPRQDYPIDGQVPNLLKEHILETNIINTTPRSATSGLSNSTGGGGNDGKQKPRYQLGLKKTEPPIKKGKLVSPPFITMVRPRSANYNGNTNSNNNNNQMNHYFQNYAYYDQLIDLDLLHAFTPRSNITGGAVSQKPNINNEIIINQTTNNNPQAPRRPRSANSATRNRSHSPTSRPTSSKSSQQHNKSQSHLHHNPARKIVGYDFPVRELIQNIGKHFSDV